MKKITPSYHFLRKARSWAVVGLLWTALVPAAWAQSNLWSDRESWQHPDKALQSLRIQPGDHIADIGSGEGYFTFLLSKAVGPTGKIYAVDTDASRNDIVAKKALDEGYENVETILPKVHDPLLPKSGVDMIFTCNSYHHLEDRTNYFLNAKKYLRPKGRVVVIDFRKGAFHHYTERAIVLNEFKAAGYTLEKEHSFLPKQNFLVFSLAKN